MAAIDKAQWLSHRLRCIMHGNSQGEAVMTISVLMQNILARYAAASSGVYPTEEGA